MIDAVTSPARLWKRFKFRSYDVLLLDMNYARDTTSGGEGLELLSRILQIDACAACGADDRMGSVGLAVEAMRTGGTLCGKAWDNGKLIGTLRRNIEGWAIKTTEEAKAGESLGGGRSRLKESRTDSTASAPRRNAAQFRESKIHATWRPARGRWRDYFDAIRLNESTLAFCIAMYQAKVLPAALTMSNLQGAVRANASADRSPSEMCRHLNRLVFENTQAHRFITLFYGVLDTANRSLTYTNAGHIPPILVRSDGFQTLCRTVAQSSARFRIPTTSSARSRFNPEIT